MVKGYKILAPVIKINPKKTALSLEIIVISFAIINAAMQIAKFVYGHKCVYGLIDAFNLDLESNLPAYFSSMLLLFSGILLGVIAVFKKRNNAPYANTWALLSIIFVYLSLDELLCIHEQWNDLIRGTLHVKGAFYAAWVIPALIAVLVLAVFLYKFIFHLPLKTRLLFIAAAVFYLSGSLGLEMVEGWHICRFGFDNLAFNMMVTFEEAFEMTGAVIFIYALLGYIQDNFKEVLVKIE